MMWPRKAVLVDRLAGRCIPTLWNMNIKKCFICVACFTLYVAYLVLLMKVAPCIFLIHHDKNMNQVNKQEKNNVYVHVHQSKAWMSWQVWTFIDFFKLFQVMIFKGMYAVQTGLKYLNIKYIHTP